MKKKCVSVFLSMLLLMSALTGCGDEKNVTEVTVPDGEFAEGSVHGQVFTWAGTADIADLDAVEAQERINSEYADRTGNVRVNMAFTYDPVLMYALLEGDLMPTVYEIPNSDAQKLIANGYSRDIQALLDERGWTSDMWVDGYVEQVTDENGHMHGMPSGASTRALFCNVAIFEEAGLVDEQGDLIFPETWDELVDMAILITQKTGKIGFSLSLYDDEAMRDFVNTAWNYGAVPSVANGDGTFTSNLNSAEMLGAAQVYARLGRSNVLRINPCMSDTDYCAESVAYGKSAMCITEGRVPTELEVTSEGYAMAPVPAGPEGNQMLVEATSYWFSPEATDDEIRAALDFIEMYGTAPVWSDDQYEVLKTDAQTQMKYTGVYLPGFCVFTGERKEKELEAKEEFDEYISSYYRPFVEACKDESRYHLEEAVDPADLYDVLLDPLQEIVTDDKADIQKWLDKADSDFQAFLDYNS